MTPRVVKEAGERRLELIETALQLFRERGYEHVPVQAITDAVGVAKGTFYHHFASKDDLVDAIVQHQADALTTAARRARARCRDDALAQLRAVVGVFAGWKLDNWEVMFAVMRAMYSSANTVLWQRLLDNYDTAPIREVLAASIADGVAQGVFDTPDPASAAEAIMWLWRGMNKPLAEALLDAHSRPKGAAIALAKLKTSEVAIERILGARPGCLGLYDYEAVRQALSRDAEALQGDEA